MSIKHLSDSMRMLIAGAGLSEQQFRCSRCGVLSKAEPPTGILLPGWTCPACRIFNGEQKERLEICRSCDAPRPT